MEATTVTTRKMHENSLANLRLGAAASYQGKINCTYSILPATKEWLLESGNASKQIDVIVGKLVKGELIPKSELDRAKARIRELKKELKSLKTDAEVG